MDLLCAAFPVNGIPEPPTSRSRQPDRMKRPVVPNLLTWSGPAPLPDPVVVPTSPEPYHGAAGHVQVALMPQRTQPQPWAQPRANYLPLGTMRYLQVGPNLLVPWSHAPTCTFLRVHSTSPLVQQPNAPERQQFASLNVLSASSEIGDWRKNAGAISWGMAHSSDGLGSTSVLGGIGDPLLGIDGNTTSYADTDMDAVFVTDAIESSADSGLGGGRRGPMGGVGTYAARIFIADLEDESDMEKVDWEGN